MEGREHRARLYALDRPLGAQALTLRIGDQQIRLAGLDANLAASLLRRWGGFVRESSSVPTATLHLFRAGADPWLDQAETSENYRIEAFGPVEHRVVASYHFALGVEERPSVWRAGLTDEQSSERPDRLVENVVRFLAALLAVEAGGFAMHAAGVLRDGKAFLFAGPSRAGKSTASALVSGASSLGDDYGIVLPGDGGWLCPAVPFDNSECVEDRPSGGLYPVAGVWRLQQAPETRVETMPGSMAVATLLGCVAFAWAMPERTDEIVDHVRRFVSEMRFERLHFDRGADLWGALLGSPPGV